MIVSLRGTNGAGKSTLVRNIMKMYQDIEASFEEGRRKPIGYKLFSSDLPPLFVPGHYEIGNGGIDTIRDLNMVYNLIRLYDRRGFHVLYEGKNMTDGFNRVSQLPKCHTEIVVIDHSVTDCVRSVRLRGHIIREKTIHIIHEKVMRDAEKLRLEGFSVSVLDRALAFEKCCEILKRGECSAEHG